MSAFQKLVEHSKKVSNFGHLASIVGWDQAAVMPSGGAEARSNAMAELNVHIHSLMTQPHLGDLFAQAEEESLSTQDQAVLREMKRDWQQANLLPESLVQAQSLAGSKCEHAWRSQRGNDNWTGFEKTGQKSLNCLKKKLKFVQKLLAHHLTMPCWNCTNQAQRPRL